MKYNAHLSSDIPITEPAQDAYGFSAFAKNLAKAIRYTPNPNGLVMSINGAWGSGKSSLLNLVKHDLSTVHENDCPIIIEFNPWWFDGRDQLAAQLLAQFGERLRNESKALLKIGELMAEYSGALSKAVALSTGTPWIDKPVNVFLKMLKRKPKDVPKLKTDIANLLRGSTRRVLFIIDDLDRLTPNEIREVFKVIKALADFPNVIYLVSFDRHVVAEALDKSLGVDGNAYLEKIVQASFALPAVDSIRLQRKLFADLDALLNALPMAKFDSTYWGNVYFDGLHPFITKPRDIVRLINALAVTYPPVAGEVNPVDYIALEFLRVFQSPVYATIRDNRSMFTGVLGRSVQGDGVKAFHDAWLGNLEPGVHKHVSALMERLFPKFESAIGNMGYGSDFLSIWRREMRACSPDVSDLYFQFSVPDDYLTQTEVNKLLELSTDLPVLVATLNAATRTIRADGHSKARDYVERISLLKEDVPGEVAKRLIRALFALDKDLLIAADERGGMTSVPNSWRMSWLLNGLLERVEQNERAKLLEQCIREGKAYPTMISVVGRLAEAATKPEKRYPWMEGIDAVVANALKASVVERIASVPLVDLLATDDAAMVLFNLSSWGDPLIVKAKLVPVLVDPALLEQLLPKFLGTGTSHAMGDRVARTTYYLDPRSLEHLFDLEQLASRVEAILQNLKPESQSRIAAEKFLRGMVRVREGKPTSRDIFDDED